MLLINNKSQPALLINQQITNHNGNLYISINKSQSSHKANKQITTHEAIDFSNPAAASSLLQSGTTAIRQPDRSTGEKEREMGEVIDHGKDGGETKYLMEGDGWRDQVPRRATPPVGQVHGGDPLHWIWPTSSTSLIDEPPQHRQPDLP